MRHFIVAVYWVAYFALFKLSFLFPALVHGVPRRFTSNKHDAFVNFSNLFATVPQPRRRFPVPSARQLSLFSYSV